MKAINVYGLILWAVFASLFTSCGHIDDPISPSTDSRFIITNHSGQSIVLSSRLGYDNLDRFVEDSTSFKFAEIGFHIRNAQEDSILFNGMFIDYNKSPNDSVVLFNADRTRVLKKWEIKDRFNSGRQFFNQQYWTMKKWKEGRLYYYEWTFELLPQDIVEVVKL